MHVGMSVVFQNPDRQLSDREVYLNDLRLADLAEPLGFESIWTVEHHFTDYAMCPDVMQFLTYMAGRTEKIQLGSMIVVLPWHDPMRVAEQVSMLDTISGGRVIFGVGRGAGRIEFDGFGVPMGESRERFIECAETIIAGLEQGYCEYDGEFVKQPRADIRPAPFKSFKGRIYAAAVSPESSRIMAELGVGILIIPQKPWKEMIQELDNYRAVYREVNGAEAPPPICAGWTFCDPDEGRAFDMAKKYIGGYLHSVLEHYEFAKKPLTNTKGYEYYGKIAEKIEQYGEDGFIEFFMNLQVFGTPEQCFERIVKIRERTGSESFIGVFNYAGLPIDEAERNLRLFAAEVMPELQNLEAATAPQRKIA